MKFKTAKTIYTPYFNKWNQDVYQRSAPFKDHPCSLSADSTSGAPVVISGKLFVGLTQFLPDPTFCWDGRELTIDAPEKAIFIDEGDIEVAWKKYHQSLGIKLPDAPWGKMPEYCTWVEQKWQQQQHTLSTPQEVLSYQFILNYLETITKNTWPKGRFTVDDGWENYFGQILNLDHLGGNNPLIPEDLYLEHVNMLQEQLPYGYPVVSLLPKHIGPKAVSATNQLLAAAIIK